LIALAKKFAIKNRFEKTDSKFGAKIIAPNNEIIFRLDL